MSGIYTIGGVEPDFNTISEAISSLSTYGINGSVTFLISPGIYEEQITIGSIQGVNNSNNITFKSASINNGDVTIKYSPIISPWHVVSLSSCSRLSFENISFANGNTSGSSPKYGLVVKLESTNYVSFINCVFNGKINPTDLSEFNSLIYSQSGSNSNLTISRCTFNDGKSSIALQGSGAYSQNITISENQFNYSYGNTIHLTNTISTTLLKNNIINSGYLLEKTGVLIANSYGPINIIGNTIYGENDYELKISHCSPWSGEINVINNFITNNFGTSSILSEYCSQINIYHNTVYSFGSHAAFMIYCTSENDCKVRNNIFKANGHGVFFVLTPDLPKSSNNNVFNNELNAQIGFVYGLGYCDSLPKWRSMTNLDSNSINKRIFFKNIDDLHLDSISLGDLSLKGASLGIITDIDGDTRNVGSPYIGADENVHFPLPVELVTFMAKTKTNVVELNWKTASEINNYGFNIEKRLSNNWEKIGFVEGGGSTNTPQEYIFIDKNVNPGKQTYRLKQIDRDGKYEYSNEIEILVTDRPIKYSIFQNYPNPFNPRTILRFDLPRSSFVDLKVYNSIGQEVAVLISEYLNAGSYSHEWNADQMPSGVYMYRLQAGRYVETRRMVLLK
jgi:hypothetical protein